MRTITNSSTLSDQVTKPKYLVFIDWDTPLYLSSRATTTYDGHSWVAAPVTVGEVSMDGAGNARVSVTIQNHSLAYGAAALGDNDTEQTVKIYVAYDDASLPIAPVLLIEGVIDGFAVGVAVELSVLGKSASRGKSPRIICAPPTFNHLPPDGTRIVWGTKTLEVITR